MLLLSSPEMAFGVGGADIGEDVAAAGAKAVKAAISQAGRKESDPITALYFIPPPGTEERLIRGINTLDRATPDEISFVSNPSYKEQAGASSADRRSARLIKSSTRSGGLAGRPKRR